MKNFKNKFPSLAKLDITFDFDGVCLPKGDMLKIKKGIITSITNMKKQIMENCVDKQRINNLYKTYFGNMSIESIGRINKEIREENAKQIYPSSRRSFAEEFINKQIVQFKEELINN